MFNMASSTTHLIFACLLVIFSCSHQILARESKFFSKFPRDNGDKEEHTNIKETEIAPTPVSAPGPAPEVGSSMTEGSYELYGHETTEFHGTTPVTSATSDNNYENGLLDEELNSENHKGEEKTAFHSYSYGNNNNKNGYTREGYKGSGYTNEYYNGKDEFEIEKQGMSDTRFLEKGRYFYDIDSEGTSSSSNGEKSNYVKNENYYYGNGEKENPNYVNDENYYYGNGEKNSNYVKNENYYGDRGENSDLVQNENYYYGGKSEKNYSGFNSMDESQNQEQYQESRNEEGYQENQEEHVP